MIEYFLRKIGEQRQSYFIQRRLYSLIERNFFMFQVFKNIVAILDRADSNLSQVIKFTVFTIDMSRYADINDVFNEWLDEETAPARSLVSVTELPGGADIEIECIAIVK